VDEVLSVGDAEFQRKSLGKMESVAHSGRTVLFVSHDMAALEALCSKGLLFDRGRLVEMGPLKDTLASYIRLARPTDEVSLHHCKYFRSIDILDEDGRPTRTIPIGGRLQLRIVAEAAEPMEYPSFVVNFDNSKSQRMLSIRSPRNHLAIPRLDGRCELTCTIDALPFAPDEYSVSISLARDQTDIESAESILSFTVRNADTFGDGWGARAGVCVAPSRWRLEKANSDYRRSYSAEPAES
jgi:lipopolysaccharide transport system ATP-binding protein